jgi:hypothetical protein
MGLKKEWTGWDRTGGRSTLVSYLNPSAARDLAGEWLEPFPNKVPRSLRSLGMR